MVIEKTTNEFSDQDTSFITAKTPLESFPVASLFFTHGPLSGREVPLTSSTFFVGRSQNNNLVLSEKSVSRKHAVINFVDGEYVINDLNSLKGTYINGRKIQESTLRPGDIVNIGENRMQFRVVSPSGRWVAPGGSRAIWYVLVALLIGIVIGGGAWFFVQNHSKEKMPSEIMVKIESHYDQGIAYFNKDHDVVKARSEWKKILELDPDMKSDFAIKASKLLRSTEPPQSEE